MCGIGGFVKLNKNCEQWDYVLLEKMNKAIKHRWPDDEWAYCQNLWEHMIGLSQVRLSILDLSAAWHQPMFYDKEKWAFSHTHNQHFIESIGQNCVKIVFNGEIYNYLHIKENLTSLGYNFTTKCDTEVILAAYLEYGKDCVTMFNGFWSFVITDPINNLIFCSRDRHGKKPFYYFCDGKQFVFSSELKWILTHEDLKINKKQNIDPQALDFYFTMWYIPSPWSIYKNVKKLPARHTLILDLNQPQLSPKFDQYYEIPKYSPIHDKNLLIQEWKELLQDSVKIRMFNADVPVWAYLSGGLDSSSVVWEMTKRVEKDKLNTFSIGFQWKYDETNYINIVKDAFGTKHHHKYYLESDFQAMIANSDKQSINYFYDEPFGDYSNFPSVFVSELAKQHVTVALSGDGWDEIFGGYNMHKIGAQMSLVYKVPRFVRQLGYWLTPKTKNNMSIFSKVKEWFRVSLLSPVDFYVIAGTSTIYKSDVYKDWVREKFQEVYDAAGWNFTQAMIDFDLFYNTLSDNFLVKVDRASMSQPLEIRSPFLDYRWIEFSRKIPVKWKCDWKQTKILMRDIIADIVPSEIVNRWKQGFTPPIDQWILGSEYMNQVITWLENLHDEWVINDNWYRFYQDKVFSGNNTMFNVYKIKLFILIDWYKLWIK